MATEKRFQIIHLGNPYDFVVKDHQTNRTYGHLQGDDKSLQECLDNIADENEQLKSALKELKEIGDYQTNHIKELQEELQPIQDICKKYKIPLEDLPDVLEEYITLDNEEYEEKLKERTI